MSKNKGIIIEIMRQEDASSEPYVQSVEYFAKNDNETIANALLEINRSDDVRDTDGKPVEEIAWECSCLQQKCGACAMVINGRPRLACEAFLKEFSESVRIEPLKKFPLIKDLMVDRSIMRENLRSMRLWSEQSLSVEDGMVETSYEASRCLQCGCCLEICPNYSVEEKFYGAAAFVPTMRLLTEMTSEELSDIKKEYINHIYAGCGKSLACQDVCPAGIETERMLVKSNAIAFKKKRRKK